MSFSRIRNEIPWWPPSWVVLTAVTTKSARTPFVMKVLDPFTTHPPSTRRARVRMQATSDTASGSVMPRAPIFSPWIAVTRKRCFCSSVPNFHIGGVAIPMCPPIPALTPPDPARGSSSIRTASWRWSPPSPPYSSGYFRPRKPTAASLWKTSLGNQRSSSHCCECGRSSAATKRRIDCRSSSCSSVNGGRGKSLEHGVPAALVVEADQVAGAVAAAAVEVRTHLGDQAVAEQEPLGAAVESALAGLRVAPGHRPLDHRLVALLDPIGDLPLPVQVLHGPLRVLADRARALVRAEPRVVVDRVLGEVPRDLVRIAGVEGGVVGADVVEALAHYSPYDRPITSSMISSVPAPIRFSRRSRQARSMPYSFM